MSRGYSLDLRERVVALVAEGMTSLLVSLADKVHNAEAILADYRLFGDALWSRFNGGADGTRWYYRALAEFYAHQMPGVLADRLSQATIAFSD